MDAANRLNDLSPGKYRAISRMIDRAGHFKMVAVDQRAPMRAILKEALGRDAAFEDMGRLKRLLVEELAAESTAVLIDPEYGLPAALDVLPGGPGLIVTLEDSNFEVTPGGRKARVIPNWSVEKIKRLGADGVKFLVWYNHKADRAVIEHQHAIVRHLGEECARYDIAFLIEPLVYPHDEEPRDFARNRADYVMRSIEDLSDPAFGIDIYKLESPVDAAELGHDDAAREALTAMFRKMAAKLPGPWVMLSAAADPDKFARVLACAYAAGASGFLAGRSIWKSAAGSYPDIDAVRQKLRGTAVPYMRRLNEMTDRSGAPWTQRPHLPPASAPDQFPASFPGF
ncbi:MAG TPA: tagatose 1,6-diphosphate aldolase [Dongiaceae bacterium]|jgi:tagatose 1,6-diphosphate aldolase|nr:tagatose 1,6-diphosphate aldolase [Dongiaceae bacterium]